MVSKTYYKQLLALFVGLIFCVQVHADCLPNPSGLIGWWPGDGNANNVLGTNNGSLQGGATASASGLVGSAFNFDGTNGYVQIPNSTLLQPTNLTIEAWVKFSSLDSSAGTSGSPAGDQYIVFKQNTRTSDFEGFDLSKTRVGGSDYFRFLVASASGQTALIRSVSTISTGVWYHVAAVRGPNFTQLYVNGVLERQTNVAFAQNYGNFPLYFGTSGQAIWDHKLKGSLDEVSLYNRALSSNEVAAVYIAGAAGKCKASSSQSQILINVDLDGAPQSSKIGTAAIGQSFDDFWNAYEGAGAGHTDGTLAYLKSANGSNTPVGLRIPNVKGSWGNDSSDPMYKGYIYPNPWATSFSVIVTNLPPALYDFYLYANDGNFLLSSAGVPYGNKISYDNPITNPPIWELGRQFVVYNNVVVTNPTQPVLITCQLGVLGDAIFSGMQIRADTRPRFTLQPSNSIMSVGNDLFLNVRAEGFYAPQLQWYFAGKPMSADARVSGVKSDTLRVLNVVTNDGGIYWCVASNVTGMATSAVVVVTVNSNFCTSPPGLVSWWTGDGQALDSANTNHGVLSNGVTFVSGKVGQAFGFDGVTNLVSFVPSDSLNVGMSDGLTIECWVNPSDVAAPHPLVEWNDFSKFVPYGAHLWISHNGVLGCLFANIVDASGNFHTIQTGAGMVATNLFVHVALTYDKTTGVAALFRNGSLVASQNLGIFTPLTTYPLYLGHRPSDDGAYYKGVLDEVGIYSRALSGPEIQSIYQASFFGKCPQPIAFIQQPESKNKFELQSARFTATVTGTPPLIYQWYFNGAALADDGRINGATSNSLAIANLQTPDAGSYWLVASNLTGVVTSSVASLMVVPLACTRPADGIVAWWTANGQAYDSANTNHAMLLNGVAFDSGKVGTAFSFDGINDYATNSNPKLTNVVNSSYAIEFWARPSAGRTTTTESGGGLAGTSNQRYAVFPESGGSAVAGSGVSVGTNGVSVFEHANTYLPSLLVYDTPITNWTHIAVVYQARQPRLYLNGTLVRIGLTSGRTSFPSTSLGERGLGYGYYSGLLDEVSVYDRALSAEEVESIYFSGSFGKCPLPPFFVQPLADAPFLRGGQIILSAPTAGTPPLDFQWYFANSILNNGGRVQGATSNIMVISNAQFADSGNYFVVVNNPYGVATSAVAKVEIINAPFIVQQPTNQTGVVGNVVRFTFQPGGDEPFTYGWYQNATALTDDSRHFGTSATTLIITNLVPGDAGNYTVRVTNAFGSVTSASATLTIITPPSITTQPRGYSVPVGLPVTLTGAGSGSSPLRYQWVLNGSAVPNATNTSLTISNLAPANFGNYQLVVTNGGGAVTSIVASVTLGTVATWGSIGQAAAVPLWPAAGLSNVIAVSAGQNYSLALRQDGTVYVWGNNNQITGVPTNLNGVVGIAAGSSHALALLSNGIVRAWGLNTFGQTSVPATLSNVIAVAAGSEHSVALRSDGTMVAWGGSPFDRQTNMPAGLMKVTSIDAGGAQSLALREDGNLFAWGGRISYPVPPDVKNVMGFSANPGNNVINLVVTSNGLVRAWGATSNATNVPANVDNIIAVEAAGGSDNINNGAFAIRSNRTVTSWGGGFLGASSLTNVPTGLSNVIALAGGLTHVLALVDNNGAPLISNPPIGGTFYSGHDLVLKSKVLGIAPMALQWFKNGDPIFGATDETLVLTFAQSGDTGSYQLVASNALGVAQSVAVPVSVVDGAPKLMSQPQSRFAYYGSPFSVGASVVGTRPMQLNWLQNGVPAFSGTNYLSFDRALPQHEGNYQLVASNLLGAVTSSIAQIKFTRVAAWGSGPSLTNAPVDLGSVIGIASGYFHALAIRSNGTVAAWGTTLNGATNVPADLSNVVAVAGGSYFSVGLRGDGTVMAWGLGTSGQTAVPPGLSNVSAIAVGASHTLALLSNRTVVAWGLNSSGQRNVPANLTNVVAIAAGSIHSLALKSDGTIVGWGQIGTIPNYTNVVAIAAGYGQSLALQADGTIRAWSTGAAATGLPPGLSNIVAISAGGGVQGFYHAFALKSDGTLVGWGNNSAGQLNWPGELTSAIAISAGGVSALAYLYDRSPYFATQLLERHSASSKNVTLAALTVGQPTLNYQWRVNGNDIPGALGPTLTLTNVNRDSRGYYSAIVWNSLGVTNSREAWLDVFGPVQFSAASVGDNGEISFAVTDDFGSPLMTDALTWLEVQASTNLVNWQTVSNGLTFTNGTVLLQDPGQTNFPTRFYRLIEK